MNKVFIVGIAGGSAGGKSTFANKLKEKLNNRNTVVLPMDSYFKADSERAIVNAPITKKPYRDDNHPSSFDLGKLKQDLNEIKQSGKAEVIIIEGLLTLWDDELASIADLKLFIDCRPDERIVRRLKRNMARGLTFDQISDVYLDLVRYRHDEYVEPSKWKADLIINGSSYSEKALQIIANHIIISTSD